MNLITLENFKIAEENYYDQLKAQGQSDNGKRLENETIENYVSIINNAEKYYIDGNWKIYDKDSNLVVDSIAHIDKFLTGTGFLDVANKFYNSLNKI